MSSWIIASNMLKERLTRLQSMHDESSNHKDRDALRAAMSAIKELVRQDENSKASH